MRLAGLYANSWFCTAAAGAGAAQFRNNLMSLFLAVDKI